MDNTYILATDSSCDMPWGYYSDRGIGVISLKYSIDGEMFPDDAGMTMPCGDFYSRLRSGSRSTTSMINTQDYINFFEGFLKNDRDVVYLAFSSGLSGSCNAADVAAKELSETYKKKVYVVDSLCASMGQGLLLHMAANNRDQNMSASELVEWLENNKMYLNQHFTVDNLMHLYRGGRLSRASAIMGTLVGIKPLLKVNECGNLVPEGKSRGRAAALKGMADSLEVHGGTKSDTVFISHSDCYNDAKAVESEVIRRYSTKNTMINNIGPVIGSHTGAGTVAIFFVGNDRRPNI